MIDLCLVPDTQAWKALSETGDQHTPFLEIILRSYEVYLSPGISREIYNNFPSLNEYVRLHIRMGQIKSIYNRLFPSKL